MKIVKSLIILIIFFGVYLILLNLALSFLGNSQNQSEINLPESENEIPMNENVDISVTRNKWYGKVVENFGDQTSEKNLYLFNFIKIPLKQNNTNFIIFHIICLIWVGIITINSKGGKNEN